MIESAADAARQVFSPPFRTTLFKTVALTLAILALVWLGLEKLITGHIAVDNPTLATVLSFLTGAGLVLGLAFLVAPVSSLVAGFFLDDMAEIVESAVDPQGPRGTPPPAGQAILLAAKFAGVSALVNFGALLLLLLPGVNIIAFFAANAYLMGREYFELAALRYRPIEEVRALRRRHAVKIFFCGLPIAGLLAVPLLNLLTPLFATAFMVRMHRIIAPPPGARLVGRG